MMNGQMHVLPQSNWKKSNKPEENESGIKHMRKNESVEARSSMRHSDAKGKVRLLISYRG
jgi:hypothetical protein